MAHKTYTSQQKLQAVQDIITRKKRPTQVSWELNVADNTLIKWRNSTLNKAKLPSNPKKTRLKP